ncbi:hypothetical protein KJ644_04135 [Candidatus Dependentiae bacterium]|nr:hypothetical protein [Candidatus Dependentiae bacterium]MBU4387635.1 hypothetical protein [Candidatus Dependentiae bacterium]MCG2756452.1 hypothetical protein [Candidatus Dependentiae bacterium]
MKILNIKIVFFVSALAIFGNAFAMDNMKELLKISKKWEEKQKKFESFYRLNTETEEKTTEDKTNEKNNKTKKSRFESVQDEQKPKTTIDEILNRKNRFAKKEESFDLELLDPKKVKKWKD